MPKAPPPLRIGLDLGDQSLTALVLHPSGQLRCHHAQLEPGTQLAQILSPLLPPQPMPVEAILASRRHWSALRRGVRVALLITEGFEDVLRLDSRLQAAPASGALALSELCPPELCLGVPERLGADGSVVRSLTSEALIELRERVAALQVAAVAVVLLHSYQNDAHERTVAEALAPLGIPVSLSSQIARVPDERLRTRATLLDACLAPTLDAELRSLRSLGPVRVMCVESSGNAVPCTQEPAQVLPLRTALSAVAAGLRGIQRIAAANGLTRFIALAADDSCATLALCDPALPSGLRSPFSTSGGTAPASIPELGPGLLPEILPELIAELPAQGFQVVSYEPGQALEPLHAALLALTVEQGHDPAEYPIIPYGSAGPSFAAALAERLGSPSVWAPPAPGLIAAYGALCSPVVCQRRELLLVEASSAQQTGQVSATLHALTSRLRAELRTAGLITSDHLPGHEWLAELRYLGQRHALTLQGVSDGGPAGSGTSDLVVRFCDEHERRYGFRLPECPVELVALRVRVSVAAVTLTPGHAALVRLAAELATAERPQPPG